MSVVFWWSLKRKHGVQYAYERVSRLRPIVLFHGPATSVSIVSGLVCCHCFLEANAKMLLIV